MYLFRLGGVYGWGGCLFFFVVDDELGEGLGGEGEERLLWELYMGLG